MNKKLLFAAMSLAALTACTDNDFESQKVAEEVGSVRFEVLNNDAQTRASMGGTSGTKVVWNANDGDLFTLYFGAAAGAVTGFENACYKAEYGDTKATLSTPTMIKEGRAIMVWPVDTTFRIKSADALTLTIPDVLKAKDENTGKGGVENAIPYVSDLVNIAAYDPTGDGTKIGNKNTAGKDREYPVYMRPMASILKLKADWAGMDKIKGLTELAEDPIAPITLTSVKLITDDGGTTKFTTVLPIKWTDPTTDIANQWDNAHTNRAWEKVTDFNVAAATGVAELTTECIDGTELAQFIILPQSDIPNTGVASAAVDVNTYYGRVLIAKQAEYADSKYSNDEYDEAWYRYLSERKTVADDDENVSEAAPTSSEDPAINGKFKTVAKGVNMGMRQTINFFSRYTSKSGVVKDEPTGTAVSRYLKVNLAHLDMSNLHIKTDKQLFDVVRVWKELGLDGVTVILDGDANNQFEISQKTIAKINEINTAAASEGKSFSVKPCDVAEHKACNEIVIKDGGSVPDLAFIVINGTHQADVVLKAGQSWSWSTKAVAGKKAVTVAPAGTTGIKSFINKGTFANAAATIAIYDNAAVPVQASAIPFVNDGTWNVTAGDLTVQFDVTNNGKVNISAGAEYHQDIIGANKTTFINEATKRPTRFGGDDKEIGVVNNSGVFACTGTSTVKGEINNYGLIDHKAESAKTYITKNQNGGNFHSIFAATNKMGRINLPYDNRNEDNISISAAANEGFVSVTVSTGDGAPNDGKLDLSEVGTYVNYCIINSGVTEIKKISEDIKYLEFDDVNDTEIAWTVAAAGEYTGLMVLSPVNIKLGTTLTVKAAGATYIDAKMYVGGTFTNNGGWSGYYGDTTDNVVNNYITY